jgi:hypothetical protein
MVQGICIRIQCCGYVISIFKVPCESVHEKADSKTPQDAAQGPDDDDNGHVANGGAHQVLQAALWNRNYFFTVPVPVPSFENYGSGSDF